MLDRKTLGIIVVFNEVHFIGPALEQMLPWVDHILVSHSSRPWEGPDWPLDGTLELIDRFFMPTGRVTVDVQDWKQRETEQRNWTQSWAQDRGYEATLTIDADEFYEPHAFQEFIGKPIGKGWRAPQYHYWKGFTHRLQPVDTWLPPVYQPVTTRYMSIRDPVGGIGDHRKMESWMHHLSYVRSPERVCLKMLNSSHAMTVQAGWMKRWWRTLEQDIAIPDSCWPWPGASLRPYAQDCPPSIVESIARWKRIADRFNKLNLVAVLHGLGVDRG